MDLNVLIATNEIQMCEIQSCAVAGRIIIPDIFEIVILLRTFRRDKVRILTSKLSPNDNLRHPSERGISLTSE